MISGAVNRGDHMNENGDANTHFISYIYQDLDNPLYIHYNELNPNNLIIMLLIRQYDANKDNIKVSNWLIPNNDTNILLLIDIDKDAKYISIILQVNTTGNPSDAIDDILNIDYDFYLYNKSLKTNILNQCNSIIEEKTQKLNIIDQYINIDSHIDDFTYVTRHSIVALSNVNHPRISCSLNIPAGTTINYKYRIYKDKDTNKGAIEIWNKIGSMQYEYEKTVETYNIQLENDGYYYAIFNEIYIDKESMLFTLYGALSLMYYTNNTDVISENNLYKAYVIRSTDTQVTLSEQIEAIQIYKISYNKVNFNIPIIKESTNEVSVKSDGTGDYDNPADAVAECKESTVIKIYPGIYDCNVRAFKKRIILIGVDRNQCILRSTDGNYANPVIEGSCGYLENLTLYHQYIEGVSNEVPSSSSGGYAFHCEDEYGVGKILEFHHCILKSDFFPALGAGLRKDFTLILDDCILESNQIEGRSTYSTTGSLGALYFHDTNGTEGDQFVIVKDCFIKSKLANAICPYRAFTNKPNSIVYCTFINNIIYSETNGFTNNVWWRGDTWNDHFILKLGYGNSNSAFNTNIN